MPPFVTGLNGPLSPWFLNPAGNLSASAELAKSAAANVTNRRMHSFRLPSLNTDRGGYQRGAGQAIKRLPSLLNSSYELPPDSTPG